VADNENVGSVYEIGIDGTGYMLADTPDRPVRRQIAVLDTQAPGSDDPLSERIGRYDYVGQSDWTGGEGQAMADRPSSDTTRFYVSAGLDPFTTPGQITCLRTPSLHISDTFFLPATETSPVAVVASSSVYFTTDGAELTARADTGGANTTFLTGLAGNITGLASDGEYWYATDGATIRRNTTAADPAANWSLEDVTEIAWCVDRLVGLDNVASPAEVVTFSPAGVGTVLTMTHGTGFSLRGLTAGDGYLWYGANKPGQGHVRFWQMDSSPTNTGIAFTLPVGEAVDSMFFYLGNVMLTTTLSTGTRTIRRLYRCVASDGLLTPQRLLDIVTVDASLVITRTWMTGYDRFVAFTWPLMTLATSGIGVVDLETGGYARWYDGSTTGNVAGPVVWDGDFGFVLLGVGFFGRLEGADYETGLIDTSTLDLATPALKHLDEILVSTLPLPASTSVAVAYSVDGGTTYTTAATFNTTGATRHSVALTTEVDAASFRLRMTLTPSGASAPTVTAVLAKAHTTGLADRLIELPINCSDRLKGLNGQELPESKPGAGIARVRTLEALTGTHVSFQDIDWPVTRTSETWEVVGVDSTMTAVYDRHLGRRSDQGVATLTLRRAL
jgi:hypothetical protein